MGAYFIMKRVNVLTKGFTTPNGGAFLFHLIRHRQALRESGFDIHFYTKLKNNFSDADIIITESKFFSERWSTDTDGIIEIFNQLKQHAAKIVYFDINDSAGWPHARILPYVDYYVKNQLLRNKTRYLKPLYAHRLYTDY